MPQAIIFDIDGTLVDSVRHHAEAWVKALEPYGYSADFETMRQQLGKSGEFILPEFLSDAEIKQDSEAISRYRKRYYQENLLPEVQPFPKVKEIFERLKASHKGCSGIFRTARDGGSLSKAVGCSGFGRGCHL